MKLQELSLKDATETEKESKAIVGSILLKQNWISYNSEEEDLTFYLIRRFLASHARMPGFFTETICGADDPLAIVRYRSDTIPLVEGAIFLNGAFIRMSYNDHENLFLFISKEDAEFWDYPTSGKVFLAIKQD